MAFLNPRLQWGSLEGLPEGAELEGQWPLWLSHRRCPSAGLASAGEFSSPSPSVTVIHKTALSRNLHLDANINEWVPSTGIWAFGGPRQGVFVEKDGS